MAEFFSPGLMERLGTLWRDLVPQREEPMVEGLQPDLPDSDREIVRAQMKSCLEGKGGDVSARTRAAQLGKAYLSLNAKGKEHFLRLMAEDFDTDHRAVDAAISRLLAAVDPDARDQAERSLRKTLDAPRRKLLTQFNALPNGVKFLVDMRSDLMPLAKKDRHLRGLENDLKYLLRSWFDVGFLELRQITWDSPASILEKIVAYEAVHAIKDWHDLKNRLDSDRRLYAFFHPRMPDEPLIFVQVALLAGLAGNIQELLDIGAPVGDASEANTAIFYSISNAQRGLDGISFGNFLIKKVVQTLSKEFSNLKTFATLSPMPGFRKWLDGYLAEKGDAALLPAEQKQLAAFAKKQGLSGKTGLAGCLQRPDLLEDAALAEVIREPLIRLGALYLALEKRPAREEGGVATAANPVAHFHLTNGARIERLNWVGDRSANGMEQAYGLMVNYLYKLNEIERNHEIYSEQGKAVLSSSVRALLKG
ncbi:malonyl-CoA decarboxylase [Insolitispirillum peregrinum]|uniref:malonyl-CoA decarboxylase n=1 Tax=Insolitispirillum peregrinum TaxID=80876 RepID=UPI003622E103